MTSIHTPVVYNDGNGIIITITLISNVPQQQPGGLYVTFSISAPVIPTLTRTFDLHDSMAVKQLGYFTPLRLMGSAYYAAMAAFIALIENSGRGQLQLAEEGDGSSSVQEPVEESGRGQLQLAEEGDGCSSIREMVAAAAVHDNETAYAQPVPANRIAAGYHARPAVNTLAQCNPKIRHHKADAPYRPLRSPPLTTVRHTATMPCVAPEAALVKASKPNDKKNY